MKMKFLILLSLFLTSQTALAQPVFDRFYTTFAPTRLFLNPGYTGFESKGNLHAFTTQYFSASPDINQQAYVFAYDGRIKESGHNLGGMFFFDRYAGPSDLGAFQLELQIPYAYRIKLGERKKLSLGAAPLFQYFRTDFSSGGQGIIRESFNIGINLGGWLKINDFYTGLSTAFKTDLSSDNLTNDGYSLVNFQLGYRIKYTESFSITPLINFRTLQTGSSSQNIDLGFLAGFSDDLLMLGYAHSFTVNAGYTYHGAFTAMLNLAEKLTLSANYRIPKSNFSGAGINVVELGVNYRFGEPDSQ